MVAKITIPRSLEAALNYNEKKVQKGAAKCLYAGNFLNDAAKINFYQKLDRYETNNRLNKMASTKTLHVSLNFQPGENLSDNKLIEIASGYMDRIGFGMQPFLVYRHEDAGHPHIHIVSTTIKNDGRRINTHNIGRNQSEKARKEMEQIYGLVKAERQHHLQKDALRPVGFEIAIYGRSETKRSISNVVAAVLSQYRFVSLPEFNAALKQFNVVADRGKEESRIYRNRGLVYRILDAQGNKVGVPIKASSIGCKPILANLEIKFTANMPLKEPLKQRTKNAIDDCVQASPHSIRDLITALTRHHIYTVLRQNAEGRLYGITFVDNHQRVVFNGSDLGKGYSVAALQSRLVKGNDNQVAQEEIKTGGSVPGEALSNLHEKTIPFALKSKGLMDVLLNPNEQYDNTPQALIKKKKKKKRRKHEL